MPRPRAGLLTSYLVLRTSYFYRRALAKAKSEIAHAQVDVIREAGRDTTHYLLMTTYYLPLTTYDLRLTTYDLRPGGGRSRGWSGQPHADDPLRDHRARRGSTQAPARPLTTDYLLLTTYYLLLATDY